MAEKRVSVRLAATGGRQVRAELEGVGEAGKRGFGRLSREMEEANRRLATFARRAKVAVAAAASALVAAAGAMIRSGLQVVAVAGHAQDSGEVTVSLLEAPVRSVAIGDTFAIRAGCDKRLETCRAKFGNVVNFRGFPHIPGQDAVIRYASRDGGHEGAVL